MSLSPHDQRKGNEVIEQSHSKKGKPDILSPGHAPAAQNNDGMENKSRAKNTQEDQCERRQSLKRYTGKEERTAPDNGKCYKEEPVELTH